MGSNRGTGEPEGCDCCGRDAEDCGMFELGWVRDVGDGTFCRPCAHVLRIVRVVEYCTWCKTPMVEEERADSEGWAYYADPLGDLHPCCPGCLAEHFGITARISLHEA